MNTATSEACCWVAGIAEVVILDLTLVVNAPCYLRHFLL
jgi:hypothetical protein